MSKKINLPNEEIFQFYEGTDPQYFSPLTGQNLNRPVNQLKENMDYLKDRVEVIIDSTPGAIGAADTAGFGVGIYPFESDLDELNITPMDGNTNRNHANYGNYIHENGSILVFIPKFYYRIGHSSAPGFSKYGPNTLEVRGPEYYSDSTEAANDGFILHRAFIDGGEEKSGFFIDKYINSPSMSDSNVAVSRKLGQPISLTTTANMIKSQGMTGCTGIISDGIVLARARGDGWNVSTLFMYSALAMLSVVHGQNATSDTFCKWYDANGTRNFPKGCNNNLLGDANDASLTFISSGEDPYPMKPLAGSASDLAKVAHNGQLSGVMDLNGSIWEVALGLTQPGASATDSAIPNSNTVYVLKESVKLGDITSGWNSGNDAWGDSDHLDQFYDSYELDVDISQFDTSTITRWGNGNNPVFYDEDSGVERALCGVVPKDENAHSSSGVNLFGQDGFWRLSRANMFVRSGGSWGSSSHSGVFVRHFDGWRSNSSDASGFRSARYGR